jgi:hypothetical protein
MTSESVIGEITEIRHIRYGAGGNRNKSITVRYMVDGVEYRKAFNEHSTFMRVGKKIKLYCRKDNPDLAKTASGNMFMVFVLLAIGIVFVVVSIYFPEYIGMSQSRLPQ